MSILQSYCIDIQSYSSITASIVILLFAAYYSNTDSVYITHGAYCLSLSLHLYLLTYNKYIVDILRRSIYD